MRNKCFFGIFILLSTVLSSCAQSSGDEQRVKIAVGNTHSMAIKSDNSLWVWGENTFGQLGNGKKTLYDGYYSSTIVENNDLYTPTKLLENIIDIAAGNGFSLAVNSNNELLTWGTNNYGQLGNGTTIQISNPQKILNDVVYIDAYGDTAVAIKRDNTLWMWGKDIRINLATTPNNFLTSPVLILDNVKKAVVGSSCIIILDNNNQVHGIGAVRELGINDRRPNEIITSPSLILSNIKEIAGSGQTLFALSHDSRLFGWGAQGNEGRVGNGSSESWVYSPVLISDSVEMVFSGFMFIKNDDSLWTWGHIRSLYNFRATIDGQNIDTGGGILNTPMIIYDNRPVKIMDNVLIACGNLFHRMVVDKKGNLYTWGNNQFGQLGNGNASIFGMIYDNDDNDDEGYFSFLQDNSVINPTIIANLFVINERKLFRNLSFRTTPMIDKKK